jgi:hypothetical protein
MATFVAGGNLRPFQFSLFTPTGAFIIIMIYAYHIISLHLFYILLPFEYTFRKSKHTYGRHILACTLLFEVFKKLSLHSMGWLLRWSNYGHLKFSAYGSYFD